MNFPKFPVDAGMIGAIPLSAVEDHDGTRFGLVVSVPGSSTLRQQYHRGTMVFTVGIGGGADTAPGEEEAWYIGDLCYVLENNIPMDGPDWTKATDAVGYHAACVQSMRTPRDGSAGSLVFNLANGRQGLVQSTAYGDGAYTGQLYMEDGMLFELSIDTGGEDEDEDEEE